MTDETKPPVPVSWPGRDADGNIVMSAEARDAIRNIGKATGAGIAAAASAGGRLPIGVAALGSASDREAFRKMLRGFEAGMAAWLSGGGTGE